MNAVKTTIRDAATLILVARNTKLNSHFDYRVLLLERGAKSAFMPSTYVFPGGVIETKADFSNEWMELFKQSFAKFGKDFTSLVNIQGPRPPLLKKSITDIPSEVAFRICAIRETFEESGILLLKRLTDEQQSHLNVDEIQNWRKQIYADATKFLTMCRELDCVPDVWSLTEWCNWLTPISLPRRFDTLFYTCFLDDEPTVLLDDKEMSHAKWMIPASAALECQKKQMKLGVPQIYEVSRFCQFPKWKDFKNFQEGRALQGCERWLPMLINCRDGVLELFPRDDLYQSEYNKVTEELSGLRPRLLCELPGSLADCNSMGKNFHRMTHDHDTPYRIICNIKLPHGQCSPVTDPVRIQELATELKPHL